MTQTQPIHPVLSRQVSAGSVWMLINTMISKTLSLLAQFAMGWFLSDRDFGIYAIAISVSTVASLLRDGGLSRLLIRRGGEYDRLQGPVFWMMLAFNCLAGILLVAAAPLAAEFYREPQLNALLLLVALSLPLLAPGSVLSAKLSVDLRYRELGAIQVCSSILRYAGMVVLGWLGFGAASFLLPVLFVALFEWLALWILTRSSPWRHAFGLAAWPALFADTKWVLLGTFAIGFMNYGAYFVIGKLVAKEVVGIYFFAFQIVLQIGVLLSNNLYQVMFPAFARIAADTERCRAALLRSINIVMIANTWLSLILVPVFAPTEALIWHGKWAPADASVEILSMCYPPSVLLSIVMAIQSARGEFRAWGLMTLGLAAGTVLAAGAGAYWIGTSEAIALFSSAFTVLGTFAYALWALRPYSIGAGLLLRNVLPAWLIGIAAALAAQGAREMFSATPRPTGWFDWKLGALGSPAVHFLTQIAGSALLFSGLYFAAVRLVRPIYLRQSLELLPKRFGSSISRFLLLGSR